MPLKLCMMVQIYLVPKKLVLPIIEHINKGARFHLQDRRYILKNNAINTYLKELSKQLCCSGKE